MNRNVFLTNFAEKKNMTQQEISTLLQSFDVCMMTTISGEGDINSRPMLQNKEAEYNGYLHFFSLKDTRKVRDLNDIPTISLTYQDKENTMFLQVHGEGEIINSTAEMAPHWDKKLDTWWHERENTPEMCMIRVKVTWIRYWNQGKDYVFEQ
jgi:general stress protein 26